MGLDMYLTGKKIVMDARLDLREDGFPLGSKALDLGYWRKHPNLHGYLVQAFADELVQPIPKLRAILVQKAAQPTTAQQAAAQPSIEHAAQNAVILSAAKDPCSCLCLLS